MRATYKTNPRSRSLKNFNNFNKKLSALGQELLLFQEKKLDKTFGHFMNQINIQIKTSAHT